MLKMFKLYVSTVLFAMSANANATIITLDGNNIRYDGIYNEAGYQISAPINLVNGGNLGERAHLTDIGFSGDYMETWNTQAIFTFEQITGAAFNLVALDVGSYFSRDGGLAAWTFRGFNNDKEVFSLTNVEYYGRLVLDWADLTRFTIQSSRASAASSFDNIEVVETALQTQDNQVVSIDEPQMLAIFSLALLGLRSRKRIDQ